MNLTKVNIKLLIISIGLLSVLMLSLSGALSANLGNVVAMILIVFLGIPHGANDHILFRQIKSTKQTHFLAAFLMRYLVLMGLLVMVWWILPMLGLLIFLAVSIYHFGESEWHELAQNNQPINIHYLIWGIFVLATPLLWNYSETGPVIEGLLGFRVDIDFTLCTYIPLALFVVAVTSVFILFIKKRIDAKRCAIEVASAIALLFIFWYANLLIGFAIYFVFWHSIPSIRDQIAIFKSTKPNYNLSQYLKEIIPFTIIAFIGIGLFALLTPTALLSSKWVAHFFIMVSIMTLPHSLLMHRLLKKRAMTDFSKHTNTQGESIKLKLKKTANPSKWTNTFNHLLSHQQEIGESPSG